MQSFRCYATEATPSKSSATPYVIGAAAIGAGVLGYNFLGNPAVAEAPKPAADTKAASDQPAKKTFTGGDQGFVDLKLKAVEKYNHNTKKLIFELPDDEVSGLNVACMPFPHSPDPHQN
jgi:cytochrome-b5 reductase